MKIPRKIRNGIAEHVKYCQFSRNIQLENRNKRQTKRNWFNKAQINSTASLILSPSTCESTTLHWFSRPTLKSSVFFKVQRPSEINTKLNQACSDPKAIHGNSSKNYEAIHKLFYNFLPENFRITSTPLKCKKLFLKMRKYCKLRKLWNFSVSWR